MNYESDEDVTFSPTPKVCNSLIIFLSAMLSCVQATATPGPILAKRSAASDAPVSQSKKPRVSAGAQALTDAGKAFADMTGVIKQGFQLLQPPKTPTRREGPSTVVDSSPVRAGKAASTAAVLEMEHLGDAVEVTKFLVYLERKPQAVVTYNSLTAPQFDPLRRAYVKQCLKNYEEEEERKAMGL